MLINRLLGGSLLILLCSGTTLTLADINSNNQWSIHKQAGLPDWLTVTLNHRTRFETLGNSFRRGTAGGDQVFAFRTQVFAEAAFDHFRIGGEFIDSRIDGPTANTPVNNTLVNEVALLQAYLAWHTDNLIRSGLAADVKFGRITMDFGSRRLIARNRYRNTINNFTGIDFALSQNETWQWRNFAVLPVTRLPGNQQQIRSGTTHVDEQNFNTLFAGSFLSYANLPLASTGEIYFYQLSESDSKNIATRNRNLSTPGIRWYRNSKLGDWDFEFESALQTGTSRASAAANARKLNHFAYFGHVAVGYTFDLPWTPRVLLQYDYASGDEDPTDGHISRFDTLFGARRFEFGPTNTWGAFARSNINTPGIRVIVNPAPDVSAFIAHRAFWLAERRDTWVGGNLTDPTGQSGDFVGQQLEIRARWKAIPNTVMFETGWAHLFKGQFARSAPGAPVDTNDVDYFYVSTSLAF